MSWLIVLVIGLTGSGEASWKAAGLKLQQGTGLCSADRKHLPSYIDLNLHGSHKRNISDGYGWWEVESAGLSDGGSGEDRKRVSRVGSRL